MAKIITNKKGFRIIQMDINEAAKLHFGIEGSGACVCMQCNNGILGNINYLPILNDCMCDKCLDKYLSKATYFEDDRDYEESHLNYYKKLLNIK